MQLKADRINFLRQLSPRQFHPLKTGLTASHPPQYLPIPEATWHRILMTPFQLRLKTPEMYEACSCCERNASNSKQFYVKIRVKISEII
jgi:hypothetical protein